MIDLRLSARQKLENILADDQVFRGLSLAVKQNILQHAQFSRHHAHQQILQQHQCISDVYILLSGTLQVGWLQADGKLIVNDFIRIQSVFNLVSVLQQQALNFDYFAAEHVELAIIPSELFFQLLKNEPEAMWHIIQLLSRRMYAMFEQNRYLRTASLTQRIARHIIKLYEQYGYQAQIPFKLSQQEFAELFNISRQTLNKHLQLFVQQQIVDWSYSQIRILDLDKLKQMSVLH